MTFDFINNKNLFSNHYLENLIQQNPEWEMNDHEEAFKEIKKIFGSVVGFVDTLNESQLEDRFFKPIFKIILPYFEVQEKTEERDIPDYAFFRDKDACDSAHKEKGDKSFYLNAFSVGEVKKWDMELDRIGRDKHDKRKNPSFQIWLYLHETEPEWGILSNGRKWRLYHQDKPLDCYYEIDLVTILEDEDLDAFKYFYYFFRAEAFLISDKGDAFLDRVLKESADYAREIGDNLKENIYRAMKIIADGFFNWAGNDLDPLDEKTREEVQASTMRLLYRFLFLLYAEGKGLLDLKNPQYRNNHSFYRLKKEIAEKKDGPRKDYYSSASTALWYGLKDLFRLIDQGSKAFGIPKDQFHVPPYNGGLFEVDKNPNLEQWIIGDVYLADAIDLLSRSRTNGEQKAFVDYSTLEIRHLGSIYEGLLEYKLKIAEEDLVVKGKKKRKWVSLEEYNKGRKKKKDFNDFEEFDKVKADNLFLATEKGERKVTGSYYTPDYIVNFIIENTVGSAIEEKWRGTKKGKSLVDTVLSINVLDPAMGSGHFLVGAIEFLAGKLIEATQQDIEVGLIEDDGHFTTDWAKREVVSHCIYGVDLNYLAVELAKVSLWLTTISKDKPLSFLDHRLKQGNTLIGADLENLPWHPLKKIDKKQRRIDIPVGFIKKIVDTVEKIAAIDDDTLEHVKEKEEIYEWFRDTKEYDMIKTLADVRTSIYFGNDIDENVYGNYTGDAFWSDDEEWKGRRKKNFAKMAREIANKKNFFHWELEFPEIFFEEGKLLDNPGFDVVVGNPPYVFIISVPEVERDFYFKTYITCDYRFDIYGLFIEQGLGLLKKGGRFGYITPHSMLNNNSFEKLRTNIIDLAKKIQIIDFQDKIFADAANEPMIILVQLQDCEGTPDLRSALIPSKELPRVNQKLKSYSASLVDDLPGRPFLLRGDKWLQRLLQNPHTSRLKKFTLITQGLRTGDNSKFLSDKAIKSEHRKVIAGSDIDRYTLNWPRTFVLYDRDKLDAPRDEKFWVATEKILLQEIRNVHLARRIVACLTTDDYIGLNTTNVIILNSDSEISLYYIKAILSSRLINEFFRTCFIDNHVATQYLNSIPIRSIFFNTLNLNKKELCKDAERLYKEYLENNNLKPLINFIEAQLPTDKEDNPLIDKEKSDVIHDFLAFLVKRMLEMNKKRQTIVKTFWEDLEGMLDKSTYEKLIKGKQERTIFKNCEKCRDYIGGDSRSTKSLDESLAWGEGAFKEFTKLLGGKISNFSSVVDIYRQYGPKYEELINQIQSTDGLIDQIVYKLYGLTEEEIEVVEKAF